MIPPSLAGASVVFWDFDGVIKESVTVKSQGFHQLFEPYGDDVAERVLRHHEAHGGVSRYEKIPLYLRWAGEPASAQQVEAFCERFSRLVRQAVIDAPWVPGVREYLHAHQIHQRSVLVSATPQDEMQQIVDVLALTPCFLEVHGAPTSKATAIRIVLDRLACPPEHAVVVGDSATDLVAAEVNQVSLLLRKTPLNRDLQARYAGPMFQDLSHE